MRFRPRQLDTDTEINLTPLIDVVFLLLIFFMVTTTFSKEAEVKVQLPEAGSAENVTRDNVLVIQIDQLGQFSVKGAADEHPRQLVNSSHRTLQATIRQAASQMEQPMVLIRADRLTAHENVVKAMDAARRLGLYQITFATDTQ